jgi:site-specific DNA-methyltransferase (adenine-specific)
MRWGLKGIDRFNFPFNRPRDCENMSKPSIFYQDEQVTLWHGCALEVLPILDRESIHAVISDPPWGINLDTDNSRFSGGTAGNVAKRGNGPGNGAGVPIIGDDEPFDPEPWISFPRVILWGGNHFAQRLPAGTWLAWIKRNDEAFGSFLSDGEIAWMKGGHGVYFKRDLSMNAEALTRVHPTQKPIPLMQWCIEKAKVPAGGLILDPYAGSGSTLLAAKLNGYRSIGVEIREDYCEAIADRCRQMMLFGASP